MMGRNDLRRRAAGASIPTCLLSAGMALVALACTTDRSDAVLGASAGQSGEGGPAAGDPPATPPTPDAPGNPGAPPNPPGTPTPDPGPTPPAGEPSEPTPAPYDAGTTVDPSDAGNGTPPAEPVGDWGPGDYPPNLMAEEYLEITGVPGQANRARQYKVHVPPTYDPTVPTPLLFCIHGLGQTPVLFCLNGTQMHMAADAAGYLLVMPFGYQNSWNAGSCCGGASTEQLDDVALFRALLDEVSTHLNVDRSRVFATGFSNGGYMSFRLACDAADMVRAIAPAAGAVGINTIGGGTNPASDFTTCEPSEPVSVLASNGTADFLIPHRLQAPTFDLLGEAYGCDANATPAAAPTSAGDTTCETRAGCQDGVELTACTVQGGGHCWFGSEDCGTGAGAVGTVFVGNGSDTLRFTEEIFPFFERVAP